MRFLQVLALALLVAGLATAAFASDINFGGYARSVGMGGAGLALSDSASETVLTNPAAGAASGAKMQFVFPSLGLNTQGTSIGELRSRTSEISGTGGDDAIRLAEDFGSHKTTLNADLMTGVAGQLSVLAKGEAQGIINPGANFRAWVGAGHPATPAGLLAAGLTADATAPTVAAYAAALGTGTFVGAKLVYSVPEVAYGRGFDTRSGKLWAGGNAKILRSEVRLWDIAAAVVGTDVDLAATERPAMKDSGLGLDLGFIFQPTKSKVQYGMVVNNFLDPGLSGVDTPRMLSVGAATKLNKLIIASDLIDISSAGSDGTRLRTGFEWQPISKLALRAGYSGKGFTWGFGVIGLNFAFTNDAPNMISKVLAY